MVSQALIVLSLLVVSAASVEQKVSIFEGSKDGCVVLDTTYTGIDLMTGTSCKKVVRVSPEKGEGTVGLKYIGNQKELKFKVHDTCDDIDGTTVVMWANEAESAKILAGECGEVTAYIGDDKGTTFGTTFTAKMYMKMTPPTNSPAPTTTTAALAFTDQAESTNMVMPMVLLVLARMLLAY